MSDAAARATSPRKPPPTSKGQHSLAPRVLLPSQAERARKRRPLMAALQDSGSKDPAAKRAAMGGGGEPKQKRARSVGVDAGGGGGSSAPATAPASESRAHPVNAAPSLVDVSVEDADALDGVACYPQGTLNRIRAEATRDAERARKGGPLMAALQDLGSKYPAAKQAGRGIGGEPQQKQARSIRVDTGGGRGSSAPATVPASESRSHPENAAASLDVTVEDAEAFDCVVCYHPLKPPIFQCDVGHAICSPCHDKLQATGKCAVCGVVTGRYCRCHVMERLVESIRVQCPYAAHGCALRPVYYDQESHRSVCVHAPCHCPGETCSFVGSTTALLDHFSTEHRWPCNTTVKVDDKGFFAVRLRDGFNLLVTDLYTGNKGQDATANIQCLLLLTVARQPYCRIISVHCIDPHAGTTGGGQGPTSKEMQCDLMYSKLHLDTKRGINQLTINHSHFQESMFRVICTDLSNGLPKPDDCFQFIVSNPGIGDPAKDGIQVQVRIVIE